MTRSQDDCIRLLGACDTCPHHPKRLNLRSLRECKVRESSEVVLALGPRERRHAPARRAVSYAVTCPCCARPWEASSPSALYCPACQREAKRLGLHCRRCWKCDRGFLGERRTQACPTCAAEMPALR